MHISSISLVYYCISCDITHSNTTTEGTAICPFCKKGRKDLYNQVDKTTIECRKCRCRFPEYIFGNKMTCPNLCNQTQGGCDEQQTSSIIGN